MQPPNKLPLLKSALKLLVEQLDGGDRVAIVVYANAEGLVLPSTPGSEKSFILNKIDMLSAGGSTNGGSGLKLAYQVARDNFIPGGVNRVILATDGDFNVGVTNKGELLRLIGKDARNGIFLTALGFGMGNYKDDRLETLADKGNGNYAYIDTIKEARKVLVEELGGTLVTIAKDVKIQVEFNPIQVGAYRLIGYENRLLNKEDFNDDRKDAGEIGAGHTVTALYEIAPPGSEGQVRAVDTLKYQSNPDFSRAAAGDEILTLKIRYKEPEADRSRLLEFPIVDEGLSLKQASPDFKFAAAVAEFGMILRESEHKGNASFDDVRELAIAGMGADEYGYRAEFLRLVGLAAVYQENR
jgi:Ca-activated chloride channel family protein